MIAGYTIDDCNIISDSLWPSTYNHKPSSVLPLGAFKCVATNTEILTFVFPGAANTSSETGGGLVVRVPETGVGVATEGARPL